MAWKTFSRPCTMARGLLPAMTRQCGGWLLTMWSIGWRRASFDLAVHGKACQPRSHSHSHTANDTVTAKDTDTDTDTARKATYAAS